MLYSIPNFLLALRVQPRPSLESLQSWSKILYDEARGEPLSQENLDVACKITTAAVRLLEEKISGSTPSALSPSALADDRSTEEGDAMSLLPDEFQQFSSQLRVYIPDFRSIMRLATDELFYNDAPWLQPHIDMNKIPLIHQKINPSTAMNLGVRSLSTSVSTIVNITQLQALDQSRLDENISQSLRRWNKTLRSAIFQGALRRAIHHATKSNRTSQYRRAVGGAGGAGGSRAGGRGAAANAGFGSSGYHNPPSRLSKAEVNYRLCILSQGKITIASNIPTRFTLLMRQQVEDITLGQQVSTAVTVIEAGNGANSAVSKQILNHSMDELPPEGFPVIYLANQNGLGNKKLIRKW